MLGELVSELLRRGVKPDQIKGCTTQEIDILEQEMGQSLPQVYREFMLTMGCGTGAFLKGMFYGYTATCHHLQLKDLFLGEINQELEDTGSSERVPEDAFFFAIDPGMYYFYFCLSDGDNPAVYYYAEGQHLLVASCFTDFLIDRTKSVHPFFD